MELHELLEQVIDEKSFLLFAKSLQADKEDESRKEKASPSGIYNRGHNGWENADIEGFLESAIAFVEDSQAWSDESNHWKKFALFLYGGKIYE